MIILDTLQWSDCFRFGKGNKICFKDSTLTQILGTNGLGKSSIPLILEEVLFNKNSKNVKKAAIPNRIANDGYWINLTFQIDEDEYEIDLVRKTSIKVKLFRNGDDISSHTATATYQTIQDLFGHEFKVFSQLVYQNPKASLQFLTATDTNRKKFLIDLLHLEEYVALFEIFKEAAKEVTQEVSGYEATIATIDKWLKDNKLTDTTVLPMINLEINTEMEEKALSQLTSELENISQKNKKIATNNQFKKMLDGINLNEINSIKATQILSYDHLQKEIGTLEADKHAARKVLLQIGKLGDTCHVCEQPVDPLFKKNLEEKETQIALYAEQKITEIQGEISEIKRNNEEYTRKCHLQKDWEDLYRSIDLYLPQSILDANERQKRIRDLQTVIQGAKKRVQESSKIDQERTKRNTRIQVILEQTDAFIADLEKAKKSMAKSVELLSSLEMLKKAFSTNGLLAYKIENMVKDLEVLVNQYLSELSDGMFTLEFVLNNDKLNVMITENGATVDIEELSSGQLARVNTATLLAIRKLMSSISKSKINVLFLDEVISVLDDEGKEKLVEVLLQEEELNTYVVSHGWMHPLLNKITVVNRGKISILE